MNLVAAAHASSDASSFTSAWIAAGAAVLAAITTSVLAIVAVLQMRASDRQLAALRSHVEATSRLANAAEEQARRDVLKSAGLPFGAPEQEMATALRGIAHSLARAFPQPLAATDEGTPADSV